MMATKYPFLIFAIIFLACSNQDQENSYGEGSVDTIDYRVERSSPTRENPPEEKSEEVMDCVFDTSTFKFTKEAIQKADPDLKYQWNDKEKEAIIVYENGDSLMLHIGGCNHFSYLATFRTDASKFEDDTYLINKAQWIAKNFFSNGFDTNYDTYISQKKYVLEESDNALIKSYAITDTTMEVTDVYEGFSFKKLGGRTEIWIHGYVN